MDINAFIPPGYIRNEVQKLDIYKRIAGIENEEEYHDMQDELIDRFGDMPDSVENLLSIAYTKALAHQADIVEISANKKEIKITMYEKAEVDGARIPEVINAHGRKLKFYLDKKPYFIYSFDKKESVDTAKMLQVVRELVEQISAIHLAKEVKN